MIKLIVTKQDGCYDVTVQNNGINEYQYSFHTELQAGAFCSGFQCAKTVINGLVQSLPMTYETVNKSKEPLTIGQQLSKQFVGSI